VIFFRSRSEAAHAIIGFTCAFAILFHFHDQFWWPVDEGVYAYVAQRANAGDVIHGDLVDLHSGYGNIMNALAFRLFGEDLLSLRYPLALIAMVQCAATFFLLRDRGPFVAFTGIVAVAAFSFVQFPNPSANWHALGAFFFLALVLEKLPSGSALRLLLAGLLVGACFFTRQLSGVFLGVGLVVVLLAETSRSVEKPRLPGIAIGGLFLVAVTAYVTSKQNIFGLIWGGAWPVALLSIVTLQARIGLVEALRTAAFVTAGFVAAGLPIVALAVWDGAFFAWASDIFFTALMINDQEFIDQASYATVIKLAVSNVTGSSGVVALVSGVMWIALIICVPILGLTGSVRAGRDPASVPPTVLLAIVWATTGLHYQIPIYLLFVLPAAFVALLMIGPGSVVAPALFMLSAWAIAFQAGQPLERGLAGTVAGVRAAPNVLADLPRVGLRIAPEDRVLYREVLAAIERKSRPGSTLMTIPMDPQLNFMTGRPSPVHYYGTPLGLLTVEDVDATVESLDAAAPVVIVHRRADKYMTDLSARLLERVAARSGPPERIGPFDLYLYRGAQPDRAFSLER